MWQFTTSVGLDSLMLLSKDKKGNSNLHCMALQLESHLHALAWT